MSKAHKALSNTPIVINIFLSSINTYTLTFSLSTSLGVTRSPRKFLLKTKKIFFFNVDHFRVFIEFVTVLFVLIWFFELETCGVSTPQPGLEPTPPARKVKL